MSLCCMAAPLLRVLLVDDHAVVRQGIAAFLGGLPDLSVVASVDSGAAALAVIPELDPEVVLLDLRMPGMHGLEVLDEVRARHPQVRVLILSGQTGDDIIFQAFQRGAAGYLVKTIPGTDLANAVRQVRRGRLRPSPDVAAFLGARSLYAELSRREVEILTRAADGSSNKEIAATLGLAENTVKNHFRNIMGKLQISDRTGAVSLAVRRGIIDLEAC
jgi:two-component system NarL family response regulator